MATIYRKTAQGVDEVRNRSNRLTPRERSALILVDGQRSDTDLAKLILAQPAETLASLLAGGYIEALMHTAAPAVAPAVPAPRPVGDFNKLRLEAVRRLIDLVGPSADPLAMRIEKAQDVEALRPLVQLARGMIANARGEQAAAAYVAALSAF